MVKKLRIAIAQLNLTVGDIKGNLAKHVDAAIRARDDLSAELVVFPELGLTGYPPEDLLLRHEFIKAAEEALQQFIKEVSNIHCVISHPHLTPQGLYNACSLVYNGKTLGRYSKQCLPNYGVFDEDRYFMPGTEACVVNIHDVSVGLIICEDAWFSEPVKQAAAQGARIIICPNASPFEVDKHTKRLAILTQRAKQDRVAILYVNAVGGQDELIFDGGSMLISSQGEMACCAGFFKEALFPVEVKISPNAVNASHVSFTPPADIENIYQALTLSVKDYITKNQLPGVLLGVSGGIDSALTLAIAVDALGKERVRAILMPSRYTADISNEDALQLAKNLEIIHETISIEPSFQAFLASLQPVFANKVADVTEENIQARCRAVILMALSNKSGNLVLTTGNRSELAMGYCTLYGDMAGGFCVLKDIPKTLVYELANYRNQLGPVIPQRIIDRPPSAELALNQKDEDSLPPYPLLDQILYAYLNKTQSIEEIVAQGFNRAVIEKVVRLVRVNQYKRQQSAIGPRINHKSFGKDWRYPITNLFKG